jgi:hypothetical protein
MKTAEREADGHTYALEHPECDQIERRWVGYPTEADGTCLFDTDTGTLVAEVELDTDELFRKLLEWLWREEDHRGRLPGVYLGSAKEGENYDHGSN